MKNLIKILEKFDSQRTEAIKSNKWNEESVAKCFLPCAIEILCNGYFLVNDEYIIDLGSIELYYHEEDGRIKDHVMYHTNEKLPKKYKEILKTPDKLKKYLDKNHNAIIEHRGYPYFEIGSFNLHQSGVDVTFENEEHKEDKYRASFLIRSYRVIEKANIEELNHDRIPFDDCSTHIYDDMFYKGIAFDGKNSGTIHWIELENEKEGRIKLCPRKNVAEYEEKNIDGDVSFEKREANRQTDVSYFKYGTKYYVQDMKKWQFVRIINEANTK